MKKLLLLLVLSSTPFIHTMELTKCIVRNSTHHPITVLGETINPKDEKELSLQTDRMVTIADSENRVEPTCECVRRDTTLINVTQDSCSRPSLWSAQKTTRPLIIKRKVPYHWDFIICAQGSTPTFDKTFAFPMEKQVLTIEIAANIRKILVLNAQRSTRPNNDGTSQITFSEYGNRWISHVDGSTILEDDTDGLLIEAKGYEEGRGQDEMWKIKQLQLMEKNRVQQ